MNKNLLLPFLMLTVFLVTGCGLFFTDTPEDPLGDKQVDPFCFKDILRNNKEKFGFEDYFYLFHESFVYVDPNLNQYSKSRILSRLGALESQYVGGSKKDTVVVTWYMVDPTAEDPYFDKERVVTLLPRGYRVVVTGNDTLPPDTLRGEGTFNVRYDKVIQDWVLSYWKDVPADGSSRSFFHPDY